MFQRLAGVYVALCVLCTPFLVSAHATPVTYTPAASGTELQAPESITIRFTERVEEKASSLSVYGPSGTLVSTGKGTLDASDARMLSVPITNDGEGVYTVSWQVVSVDDGHFTKGGYSFLVDKTGAAYEGGEESTSVAYSTNIPDVFSSFLNLLGESIFVALFAFFSLGFVLRRELLPKRLFMHLSALALILFVSGGAAGVLRKSYELASLQGTSFIQGILA